MGQTKDHAAGDNGRQRPEAAQAPSLSSPAEGGDWDPSGQDKTFWALMAGADRRLADLRRAIDQAAQETGAREGAADAEKGPEASPGVSRCEAASRMINDALNAEKPQT